MAHVPRRLVGIGGVAAIVTSLACGASPAAGPGSHHVDIEDAEFRPGHLAVSVGDTVTWYNRDIVPHTVTLPDREVGADAVGPGETITLVVTQDGTVGYRCRYHPTMTGTLKVR